VAFMQTRQVFSLEEARGALNQKDPRKRRRSS
jgi:hypothetical protein